MGKLLFILASLIYMVGCRQDQYDRDRAICEMTVTTPEDIQPCLRSRGWHDAHGLRNN